MVADVPGYIPTTSTDTHTADSAMENILSSQHQKEFDRCMNNGTETVAVAPKDLIPIWRLAPGSSNLPNPITPAKLMPSEIRNNSKSVDSTLMDDTFEHGNLVHGSVLTLGLVNTDGTVDTAKVSSSSHLKFLCSKQKMKQE